MRFIDYDTGEVLDTDEVYRDMSRSLTHVIDCYRQIRKHKIITDELHQKTFFSSTDLLKYMIYDIKKKMDNLDK